jgi:selT/selW/selH-like putative selenoprotein
LRSHGFDATDLEGETGQFDVVADGELVFSKQQAGRFPEPGEILAALGPPGQATD